MITLFLSGCALWLGAFLLNRRPLTLLLAAQIGALIVCALMLALDSMARADLSLNLLGAIPSAGVIGSGLWLYYQDACRREDAVWLPLLRSFDGAFFTALLFGGQVALFASLLPTETQPARAVSLMTLLYGVVAAAILIQTLSGRVQTAFDQFAFAFLPMIARQRMTQSRSDLRSAIEEIPKSPPPTADLATLDDTEFTKLTRRALSSMGDLPKLAISPLVELPIIDQRLVQRGARTDALERTVELKRLLAEMIGRLKPEGSANFGTSSEWRHYNALYFPYVAGVKPYARINGEVESLSPDQREALQWFQQEVPERTLYNWQGAAARLIAQELRRHVSEN